MLTLKTTEQEVEVYLIGLHSGNFNGKALCVAFAAVFSCLEPYCSLHFWQRITVYVLPKIYYWLEAEGVTSVLCKCIRMQSSQIQAPEAIVLIHGHAFPFGVGFGFVKSV
jgi:hypothetical protein